MKKSLIPTSVLGISSADNYLPKTYFFAKLQVLNPGLGYFANNSIILGITYRSNLKKWMNMALFAKYFSNPVAY